MPKRRSILIWHIAVLSLTAAKDLGQRFEEVCMIGKRKTRERRREIGQPGSFGAVTSIVEMMFTGPEAVEIYRESVSENRKR